MIKELLEMLFIEKLSTSEAARKLSVGRDDLHNRVEMLVHMGYIKELAMARGDCEGNCWKCALAPAGPDGEGGEGKAAVGVEDSEEGVNRKSPKDSEDKVKPAGLTPAVVNDDFNKPSAQEDSEARFSWYELTEKGRRLVGK